MNIAEVVAKMNVYLLNAADVCRKWLEPRLKSLEPNDWWSMISPQLIRTSATESE